LGAATCIRGPPAQSKRAQTDPKFATTRAAQASQKPGILANIEWIGRILIKSDQFKF